MNKRRTLARILDASGLLALVDCLPGRNRLLALNYHRVGATPDSPYDPALWSADAEAFTAQLAYLKRHYDVVTAADLPDIARTRRGRYAMVTFDDGYLDNYTCAFPLLRDAGVPATFFVATGYIDAPRVPWWDEIAWMTATSTRDVLRLPGFVDDELPLDATSRGSTREWLLSVYKKLPGDRTETFLDALADASGCGRHPPVTDGGFWMNWDMLREMHAAGMCIAGHTVNHPVLSSLPRAAQAEEIRTCQARLEAEIGVAPAAFSYPVGGPNAFNDDTRACLRELGIEHAFSYHGGFVNFSRWDVHDTPRVAIEPYIDQPWFHAIARLPEVFA